MSLNNKVVVITGAAEGIGYHVADNFLQKDVAVTILLDVNAKKLQETAEKFKSKYGKNKVDNFICDVTTDLNSVFEKIIQKYKHVDVLVNNAGICADAMVNKTIDINVTSLINWSLKFWEHMRKDKGGNGGTIINMASIYGCIVTQHVPVYHASKFAVTAFTRSLGHEYNFNRTGVRVIAICPGYTATKLVKGITTLANDEKLEMDFQKFASDQLKQKAEDVGKATVDAYMRAESGTAWLIEEGKTIEPIIFNNPSNLTP